LAERPFSPLWEVPQPENHADIVVRRVIFLQSHPEYYKELPALISRVDEFAEHMKSDGITKEEIKVYQKQIRTLWWKPLLMWTPLLSRKN